MLSLLIVHCTLNPGKPIEEININASPLKTARRIDFSAKWTIVGQRLRPFIVAPKPSLDVRLAMPVFQPHGLK